MNEDTTKGAIEALKTITEALKLARHKIDQTLAGQYTDGAALSAAIYPLSSALDAASSLTAIINAHAALVGALEEIERHHVEQNSAKGRDESRSHTLRIARAALDKARPS